MDGYTMPRLGLADGPELLTDPAEVRALRKRETALGYRLLAAHGWGSDGSGHISARDPERPDHLWLLGYGVPFGLATVDDLVLVDPTGRVVEGDFEINPSAHCIHGPIHDSQPAMAGAIHTHTGYGTPFSALVQVLPMSSQEACAFHENQAVWESEDVNVLNHEQGRSLADAMGDNRLVILANHGLLTVGQTVAEAIGFFFLAERAAEVAVKAPSGRSISDEAATRAAQSVGDPTTGWHVFQWLVRSRLADPRVVESHRPG